MMMKTLTALAVLLLLGACVSDRYYPVDGGGSGGYYLADTPVSASYYHAAYSPLLAYGVSPWWGYSYYSPYFYPHYFSVWYAPWPYFDTWPYYTSRYAGYPRCCPPYGRHHHYSGPTPGAERPVVPAPDLPGHVVGPPAFNDGRWPVADERNLQRDLRYGGTPTGRSANAYAAPRSLAPAPSALPARPDHRGPGPAPAMGMGSFRQPSAPAAGIPSAPAPRSNPGMGSRRNPDQHDQ